MSLAVIITQRSEMIISILRKINAFLLDIIFPRACVRCKTPGTYLCLMCAREFCGYGGIVEASDPIKKVIYCLEYDKEPCLKQAIHYFKYNFAKELAVPFGIIIRHRFKKYFKSDKIVIVPVPLSKKRLKYRMFNQAELLARSLGPVSDVLIRVRDTKPQAKLGRAERLRNLEGAFVLRNKISLENKTVVLVDDVYTTGSTLLQCARALKPARPKEIYGIVIAKG